MTSTAYQTSHLSLPTSWQGWSQITSSVIWMKINSPRSFPRCIHVNLFQQAHDTNKPTRFVKPVFCFFRGQARAQTCVYINAGQLVSGSMWLKNNRWSQHQQSLFRAPKSSLENTLRFKGRALTKQWFFSTIRLVFPPLRKEQLHFQSMNGDCLGN